MVQALIRDGRGTLQWYEDSRASPDRRSWAQVLGLVPGTDYHYQYESVLDSDCSYQQCLFPDRSGSTVVFVGERVMDRIHITFSSRLVQGDNLIYVAAFSSERVVDTHEKILDVKAFGTTRDRRMADFVLLLESGKIQFSWSRVSFSLQHRVVALCTDGLSKLWVLLETGEICHYQVVGTILHLII